MAAEGEEGRPRAGGPATPLPARKWVFGGARRRRRQQRGGRKDARARAARRGCWKPIAANCHART
eukprot:362110-Chlamydomonas_euryale.AAC.9